MAIAILDQDNEIVNILSELVADMGQVPAPYTEKDKFLEAIDPRNHTIAIIADDFADVIEGTKQVYPDIETVAIGYQGTAADYAKIGAAYFLKKPFKVQQIKEVLQTLINNPAASDSDVHRDLISADPAMRKVMAIVEKVAPTQAPVLIQGESGTGKEVIARYIHTHSKRSGGPYIGINLAAIPETLLESELFGYEKGAFTGAYAPRTGKFEQADGGTILLDEITEIGLGLQAKLLRVLQEKQVDRVGSKAPVNVDFRVVATTNRSIEQEVKDGKFRHDLYFRLNVIPVKIPPLRERRGDILPLANHFITKISRRESVPEKHLTQAAKDSLLNYAWPGNVRELENVIERAIILSDGQEIDTDTIILSSEQMTSPADSSPGTTIHEMERRLIVSTLNEVGGNRTKAAELLGISIRTLRNKLNEYKSDGQISDV